MEVVLLIPETEISGRSNEERIGGRLAPLLPILQSRSSIVVLALGMSTALLPCPFPIPKLERSGRFHVCDHNGVQFSFLNVLTTGLVVE